MSGPVIAVLAPQWNSGGEDGWIARQVAGALACVGTVHIVTPGGRANTSKPDSVFHLHRLGTPVDVRRALRRTILIQASIDSGAPQSPGLRHLLSDGEDEPWANASSVLRDIGPDLVVIVGFRSVGAFHAVQQFSGHVPVVVVPTAQSDDASAFAFEYFTPLIERASSWLVVTESERNLVAAVTGDTDAVHQIGAPLAANSSVLREPNPWMGDTGYVVVLTNCLSHDGEDDEGALARMVRLRFPDVPVGISYRDLFAAHHQGRLTTGWPVERSSDRTRLMAWARVTVDLRPGPLFARSSVEALLYGTAIVVPAGSRAEEHARRGRGGLWFGDPAELLWTIEALLADGVAEGLGAQGQQYADAEYGSTDHFIERVTGACGLTTAPAPAAVT